MKWFYDAEKIHLLVGRIFWLLGYLLAPFLGIFFTRVSKTSKTVFGLSFKGPVGLAAGFDKDAKYLLALPWFGFDFAEIGTVTPKPQKGNPKPRLFRSFEDASIFNRMGFNNDGADRVLARLRLRKMFLPRSFIVGVNLGKNKDTPIESAHEDYAILAVKFLRDADYFVINVSSPNTPGLRDLQAPEALKKIAKAIREEMNLAGKSIPLLLKLAPELDQEALKGISAELDPMVDGYIVSNTLQGQYKYRDEFITGGYSGEMVRRHSHRALKHLKSCTQKPIVAVGGIMDREEAELRLKMGASLIQIYTGWVFGGPFFPRKLSQYLITIWK